MHSWKQSANVREPAHPFKRILSRTSHKWGDVKSPVLYPLLRSIDSTMQHVDPCTCSMIYNSASWCQAFRHASHCPLFGVLGFEMKKSLWMFCKLLQYTSQQGTALSELASSGTRLVFWVIFSVNKHHLLQLPQDFREVAVRLVPFLSYQPHALLSDLQALQSAPVSATQVPSAINIGSPDDCHRYLLSIQDHSIAFPPLDRCWKNKLLSLNDCKLFVRSEGRDTILQDCSLSECQFTSFELKNGYVWIVLRILKF